MVSDEASNLSGLDKAPISDLDEGKLAAVHEPVRTRAGDTEQRRRRRQVDERFRRRRVPASVVVRHVELLSVIAFHRR
jgi:hypothetical protein